MTARKTLACALASIGIVLSGCGESQGVDAPVNTVPELRLGMSIAEAKEAIGDRLLLPNWQLSASPDCNNYEIENTEVRGLVISREIVTVSLSPNLDVKGRLVDRGPESLAGLRLGLRLDQVVARLGRPDRISTAESSGGELLSWRLGDINGRGIFLRVNNYREPGKPPHALDSLEIGFQPYIFYGEGCA